MFSLLQVTEFLASEADKLKKLIVQQLEAGIHESYMKGDKDRLAMLCEAARMVGWRCEQSRTILKKLPETERPKVELWQMIGFLANQAGEAKDQGKKLYIDAVGKLELETK